MAIGGLLKGLGGRAKHGPAGRSPSAIDPHVRLKILESYENSGQGWFWATDSEGRLSYLSEAIAKEVGKPLEELIGQPLSELFVLERDEEEEEEGASRPLGFLLGVRNSITDFPVRAVCDGREIWWAVSGRPSFDGNGDFSGYSGHGKDITAQRREQMDAARLAQYDSLTGLANRHRMTRRLNSILTAYRSAKRSCALMMLDLDRFKHVNDTLGHPAGDELLKQVAQRLYRVVNNQGEIGRIGGDEFQVIIPDMDDRGKLGDIAGRIIQMLSQPYTIEGSRCIIGASVGVAIAPYDGIDSEELVRSADLALYAAKGGGRGQYRFYSTDLKDEAQERRLIEEDLRDALAHDQLEMHYQPTVRVKDNIVVCCEALMRWTHPERGPVSPAVFIPIAEESNLINALGEWALRTACAHAARWPGKVQVSVNVSAVQFATAGFPAVVANALAASGLEPERLELEITESVFMGDSDTNDSIFRALKGMGVKLALDDFGTGYSSLGYLRNAPFDKLKIDRSFVEACTEKDSSDAAIVSAILALSSALGMQTTVEGVEAFDQLDLVCAKGAKLVQGFIYSRAIPQDDVLERFKDGVFRIEPEGPQKHRPERRSMYRMVGVIHEDHRYEATIRDLSKTGARIEGLLGVPVGTGLVLDLGGGQLVVSHVVRSQDAVQGLEFETPLISDGSGGLCTRHRVSPYALAAAGMPLASLPPGHYPLSAMQGAPATKPQFMQVQVKNLKRPSRAA